ncbi:MAG: hypothetical protein COW30_14200, partial [Rhodospirillales bacterium CG15_BIG_FIL_POST_REV_8_21_14_020_66_15]
VDQRTQDFAKVRSEAIRQTKAALDAAGIDMPSPSYKVTLERAGAPAAALEAQRAAGVTEEPPAHEVDVDRYLQDQIADDRRRAEEPDLLETPDPSGTPDR